jgi:hypothetical protein
VTATAIAASSKVVEVKITGRNGFGSSMPDNAGFANWFGCAEPREGLRRPAKTHSARSAGQVFDEPSDPAVLILPFFQGSIFPNVIVQYLLVMLRRVQHDGSAFRIITLTLN